jgi:hypothetical protein
MTAHRERWWLVAVITGVLLMISLPYLVAMRSAGEDRVFGGFLLNPQDGNSYLAKMYEGWRGDWRFTLPYTAEKGNGAFINIFYLALGHLARISGFPLLVIFHTMRLLSAIILLLVLYRFMSYIFIDRKMRLFAFTLAACGSGLGWLSISVGLFTSDFWVAETYPFLSAFANPHFPLGLALVLTLLTFKPENVLDSKIQVSLIEGLFYAFIALLLAIVLPFGIVIVLCVLVGLAIWELYPRFLNFRFSSVVHRVVWVCLGGFPVLVYELEVITNDPLLSGWNAQNVTPSPLWWDLLISLSPVLLLAIAGGYYLLKSKVRNERLLLVWVVMGLILIYFPWNLQRRFMLGLYIPSSALAVMGLKGLVRSKSTFNLLAIILIILVIPTNLMILMAAERGVITRDPKLFLAGNELRAFDWIKANTAQDAVVLASSDIGLLIPAYTGRRVIYGHPFETVHASLEKERIARFFQDSSTIDSMELLNSVDYLYVVPGEIGLEKLPGTANLILSYQNPDAMIYRVIH